LPYWSNPSFLIFDIRALWRSRLSVRAPECQKLKIMALNPSNSSNLEKLTLKVKGGIASDPSNYRPTLLTSVFSKLMKQVIVY